MASQSWIIYSKEFRSKTQMYISIYLSIYLPIYLYNIEICIRKYIYACNSYASPPRKPTRIVGGNQRQFHLSDSARFSACNHCYKIPPDCYKYHVYVIKKVSPDLVTKQPEKVFFCFKAPHYEVIWDTNMRQIAPFQPHQSHRLPSRGEDFIFLYS